MMLRFGHRSGVSPGQLSLMPPSFGAAAPVFFRCLIPLVWTIFVLLGTFPALQAHLLSIERSYPGNWTYTLPFCAGLGSAAAIYLWRIRNRTWEYEPRAAAILLLAPIAVLQPKAAVVAAAILLAAFVWGSWIVRLLGLSTPGGSAGLSFPAVLGLAFLSLLLFMLGMWRLLNPWLLGLGVAVTIALGRLSIQRGVESLVQIDAAWRTCRSLSRPWAGFCLLYCVIVAAMAEAVLLTPPIAFDALHFHLPLIKTYTILGGLIEYPQLIDQYAYNPQNFEVLLTLAHILGGERASQLLAASLTALTLLMVVAICRLARLSIPSIVLGLAAIAGMPMVVWSASVIKNDFAMACFQMAAIYACLRLGRDSSPRWFFLSGALLGSAFGVKPTAIFAALPIGLIWIWDCRRRPDWLRTLALTGSCFALTAFAWPARTFLLTGDAFLTAPPTRALGALDPSDPEGPLNHLGRYLEVAVDAHLRGDKGIFELPIRTPFGVMTTIFAGGVLLLRKKSRNPVALRGAVIGFGSLLYWVSTMRTARYGITPILLMPFLLSPGFLTALTALGSKMRAAMSGALVYGLVFALAPSLIISNSLPQFRNLTGLLSDDDYVQLTFRFHNAFRSLEGLTSQDDDVLVAGSCAVGSAPFPWKVTCCSGPWRRCPPERIREMAANSDFVILPKRTDPAVLGEGWLLVAAPENSRAAVYAAPRRDSGDSDE
jgi:hypothetical protein